MPRLFPLCPVKVFGLVKSTYGDKQYIGAGLNFLLRLIPSDKSRQIHLCAFWMSKLWSGNTGIPLKAAVNGSEQESAVLMHRGVLSDAGSHELIK